VTISIENTIISLVNNDGEDVGYYSRQLVCSIVANSSMEKDEWKPKIRKSESSLWVKLKNIKNDIFKKLNK
jgi:hypothetical protein